MKTTIIYVDPGKSRGWVPLCTKKVNTWSLVTLKQRIGLSSMRLGDLIFPPRHDEKNATPTTGQKKKKKT